MIKQKKILRKVIPIQGEFGECTGVLIIKTNYKTKIITEYEPPSFDKVTREVWLHKIEIYIQDILYGSNEEIRGDVALVEAIEKAEKQIIDILTQKVNTGPSEGLDDILFNAGFQTMPDSNTNEKNS